MANTRLNLKRGTDLPQSKLDPDKVRAMRHQWERHGRKLRDIAADFGVTYTCVWRVVNYLDWRHVF